MGLPLPPLDDISWSYVNPVLEADAHDAYLPSVERHIRIQLARGVRGLAHHILRSVLADGHRKEKEVKAIVERAQPFLVDVLRSASRLEVTQRPARHARHEQPAVCVTLLRKKVSDTMISSHLLVREMPPPFFNEHLVRMTLTRTRLPSR